MDTAALVLRQPVEPTRRTRGAVDADLLHASDDNRTAQYGGRAAFFISLVIAVILGLMGPGGLDGGRSQASASHRAK